jgi:hypothetical protein
VLEMVGLMLEGIVCEEWGLFSRCGGASQEVQGLRRCPGPGRDGAGEEEAGEETPFD